MKSQIIPIIVIFAGVLVVYYLYKMIQASEVKKNIMTDPALTGVAIEKANAEGISFGQALDLISNNTIKNMY